MASQQLNLVAPSGDRVHVDLPADRPVSSVAAAIRFAGGSFGTGFQIGPRGYHDFACTHVAPATTRQRFLVHGREVVLAEADDGRSSVATLLGDYHELMTVYAGPAPRASRVFALFSSLQITDHTAGMVVRARSATLLDVMAEQLFVVVRGRGSLAIPGPRRAAALVPEHAGARTRFGEVWRVPYPDGGAATRSGGYFFILGCPAGTAEFHATTDVGVGQDQALAWLGEVNVQWQSGE